MKEAREKDEQCDDEKEEPRINKKGVKRSAPEAAAQPSKKRAQDERTRLQKLNMTELRKLLCERSLCTDGKTKNELITRLLSEGDAKDSASPADQATQDRNTDASPTTPDAHFTWTDCLTNCHVWPFPL